MDDDLRQSTDALQRSRDDLQRVVADALARAIATPPAPTLREALARLEAAILRLAAELRALRGDTPQ